MNGAITLNDAQEEQIQLKYTIGNFSISTRLKSQNEKDEKDFNLISINELHQGKQMLINTFKSRIFPIRNVNIDDYYI